MVDTPRPLFGASRLSLAISLVLLFGLGFAIRLYDITDLPLDFHPTRQLFYAIKARGMYYQGLADVPDWQREMAVQMWHTRVTIEPEILPKLAALLYRFTGEQLWLPRSLSACFWLVGGLFLFLLARGLVSTDGAILSLAVYLFIPYGIIASRSFQPDPLMVMSILAFWWLVWRWANAPAWKWAVLAGLTGGFAIFVKLVAVFFVVGGGLGALIGRFRLRALIRNAQFWAMVLLGILPGAAWVVYGLFIAGFLRNEFAGNFIPSLLASPSFYLGWQKNITTVVGSLGIVLGLLGVFLVRDRRTASFLLGLWSAYVVFGFYFNYFISTHDYYSLPLIPVVALSLSSVGDWSFERLAAAARKPWMRAMIYLLLLYGVGASLWMVRNEMKAVDYRPVQAYWEGISRLLGQGASVIALTNDYGSSLAYWGWQNAAAWPPSDQLKYRDIRGGKGDLETMFVERTAKKSFFLIADLDDFARQAEIKQRLYASYPVYSEGDGYLIFDLSHPYGERP